LEVRPRLLAVFGAHPDIGAQLRNAAWAARERSADTVALVEASSPLGALATGTPSRAATETWAGRQKIDLEFFSGVPALKRGLARLSVGPWIGVMVGPGTGWTSRGGLGRATIAAATEAATAAGLPVIPLSQADRSAEHHLWTTPVWRLHDDQPWYHDLIMSALAVSLSAMVANWLFGLLPEQSLALIFLPAVIYAASAYGFAAALFAIAFSLAILDYFFLPPRFSFSPPNSQTILAAALFALAASISSNLAGGLRVQAQKAERQSAEVRTLFALTRELAAARDTAEIFGIIIRRCEQVFETRCALLTPFQTTTADSASDRSRSASLQVEKPSSLELSPDDIAMARSAFAERRPAGIGPSDVPTTGTQFQPLLTSEGPVAVLALGPAPSDRRGAAGSGRLLDAICRIAGIAVERTLRARELETSRVLSQTEGLRSALLSSIAHDFGTPLASIIGSASSLISFGDGYPAEVRRELLDTILEESERLNRFVKNVLQMNKLESGALVPRFQWADVGDLIGTALDACQRRLVRHEVYVDVAERLPLIRIDFVLMENVLVNLLDNAAKYAPPDSSIQISARAHGNVLALDVTDQGRGIAADELGAVFDKFYRARKHRDRTVPGTGLGLAICKGIVEAHGGTIEALSRGLGHGTTVRVKLPIAALSDEELAEA
jgi:two-component system sensor histidine kinase KdpD